VAEETNQLQESMERSAQIGELLLPSPPRALSYAAIAVFTVAAAAFFGGTLDALLTSVLAVLAPAVGASLLGPPASRLTKGEFFHRRSSLVAALGAAWTSLGALASLLLAQIPVPPSWPLYVATGLVWVTAYAAVSTVVDNRQTVALALSSFHSLLALPGLVYAFGVESLAVGFLIWAALLGPFALMARLFDAPLMRNFGVSGAELFRAYLDHVTSESVQGERLLERFGEQVHAPVSVLAIERKDGSRKACMAIPTVHPGPFGALGGGDLPAKMRDALRDWEHVLVPHAAADHDLNPVTSDEVERLGRYASTLADRVETSPGGSRLVERGDQVRLAGQFFGSDALLTYTSWPEALDDVDQGVGHHAELKAQAHGARNATFVDCHNSLRPSAGAVYPLTPRALEIEDVADDVAEGCMAARVPEIRAGVAQDTTLGMRHLIGRAGCQVLVLETGDTRTAYVLWDGNNMEPDATSAIRDAVLDIVDDVRVMTTDNHAVNVEGGTYSPVGIRVDHQTLAEISRETTEDAIADLEPVETGIAKGYAPDVTVVGHQKTAQLAASVNVMVSVLPELVLACLALWTLGLTAVFLAF